MREILKHGQAYEVVPGAGVQVVSMMPLQFINSRKLIGIEPDPAYMALAEARIRRAPTPLFDGDETAHSSPKQG
jgi:hypothetical protein